MYPNSQTIATLAEVKALNNIGVSTYDAFINSYLNPVDRAIETYCRRRFLNATWTQWVSKDKEALVDNWPINNVLLIGVPEAVVKINDTTNSYNFTITQPTSNNISIDAKLIVTNTTTFITTEFSFATYTTLGILKAAVELALAGVTLDYQTNTTPLSYANLNTLTLRPTSGKTIYAGLNYFDQSTNTSLGDIYRISDNSDRIIFNPNFISASYFNSTSSQLGPYTTGYSNIDTGYSFESYNNADILIVYSSGYTTANMPQELKWVASSVIKDILSIYDIESSGVAKNIYSSENLGDYGYTLNKDATIANIINRYSAQLDYYKKKCI